MFFRTTRVSQEVENHSYGSRYNIQSTNTRVNKRLAKFSKLRLEPLPNAPQRKGSAFKVCLERIFHNERFRSNLRLNALTQPT